MLSLRNISLGFGGPSLLDGVSLEIRPRDRLCLVGRNGCGKSSLLKVILGEYTPDEGIIEKAPGYRVASLSQEIPELPEGNVAQLLAGGLIDSGLASWEQDSAVERMAANLKIDPSAAFHPLSTGMKRRVMLGRAAISRPDLLLLDEPTNHLDLDSILWLESFLLNFAGSLLFVTHDRAFLQKLATAILDLDRGRLIRWDGDYRNYLQRKEEWLAGEARNRAVFEKKLADEEVWIRKGIQARRTRNEGRVRALLKMRETHRQQRDLTGKARLQLDTADRSGVRVIRADKVSFSCENQPLIRDFSYDIERGDRVGIIGPNGSGKTTLVKILLGRLPPQSGSIRQGTNLKIAYFDQLRDQLDLQSSVRDNIADGAEAVETSNGQRHVISYLQDFLFTPDRAHCPVSMLSGGERNRLLLARLFTRPCNLLVMDEPTNDLDVETLDLLEEKLAEFKGTIILVSHDRAFINNVVTGLLVMEGDGRVQSCVGGYDDYLKLKEHRQAREPVPVSAPVADKRGSGRPDKPRRFLNREQRELEALPGEIEHLETRQQNLSEKLADPALYQDGGEAVQSLRRELDVIATQLAAKMDRWEALEMLQSELERK